VSSESPRSPTLETHVNSLGELIPPGTSPVIPKSPDTEMPPGFPRRGDANEMSLEEEQLVNEGKGLLVSVISKYYE